MSPKKSEKEPLKKTEKETRRLGKPITRAFLKANRGLMAELKRSLKKIKILLLVIVFAAGCTVIVYESPQRRARGVWEQHWHYCPYGSFWGHIYWQCMWYYRYPYYSRILSPGYRSRGGSVITKRQLQKPTSTERVSTTEGVVKRKVVETEKKQSKKVKKKKEE